MDVRFQSDQDIPSIHKKSKLSTLPNFAAKHDKNRESEIDRVFIIASLYIFFMCLYFCLFL